MWIWRKCNWIWCKNKKNSWAPDAVYCPTAIVNVSKCCSVNRLCSSCLNCELTFYSRRGDWHVNDRWIRPPACKHLWDRVRSAVEWDNVGRPISLSINCWAVFWLICTRKWIIWCENERPSNFCWMPNSQSMRSMIRKQSSMPVRTHIRPTVFGHSRWVEKNENGFFCSIADKCYSFQELMLCGIESDLLLFELCVFLLIDLGTFDSLLASVITFLVSNVSPLFPEVHRKFYQKSKHFAKSPLFLIPLTSPSSQSNECFTNWPNKIWSKSRSSTNDFFFEDSNLCLCTSNSIWTSFGKMWVLLVVFGENESYGFPFQLQFSIHFDDLSQFDCAQTLALWVKWTQVAVFLYLVRILRLAKINIDKF